MSNRIFVDTNCFIHLRDLKDLPWADLRSGDVEVLVAPIVVDELDRLKVEKSGRIRDRCRAALKQILSASAEPGMRIQLRKTPNAVWLVVAVAPRVDWSAFPRLDPTRPDDQLVAAALSEPGAEPASLLSFDAGPIIRARNVGLNAYRAPDSWALPPQQDQAEQRIAKLERDLAAAKSTRPVLEAGFCDAADGQLRLLIPQLPPLSLQVQERLLAEVRSRLPRQHVKADRREPWDIGGSFGTITEYAVDKYYAEYDAFIEKSRMQFARLHELMTRALRFGEVRYEIYNSSHVTAVNLRTAITCSQGLALFGDRSGMESYGGSLPRIHRPKAPQRYELPMFHRPLADLREPRRDPTGFYWLEKPTGEREAVLTCEEFRPEQRRVKAVFVVGPDDAGGAIDLEISATNMAKPIVASATLSFEPGLADWSTPAVVRRLPTWMADLIEEEMGKPKE